MLAPLSNAKMPPVLAIVYELALLKLMLPTEKLELPSETVELPVALEKLALSPATCGIYPFDQFVPVPHVPPPVGSHVPLGTADGTATLNHPSVIVARLKVPALGP